jgi:hypothetical protein
MLLSVAISATVAEIATASHLTFEKIQPELIIILISP